MVPRQASWALGGTPRSSTGAILHHSATGRVIDLVLVSCMIIAALVAVALWWAALRRHPARGLSPEKVISHRVEEVVPVDAETLFRLIAERLKVIRNTLRGSPSRIEVEMCSLGYKSCADDAITLVRLIEEDLPRSRPLRRLKLKMYQRRTTDLLRHARKDLHQHAPGTPTQKQS